MTNIRSLLLLVFVLLCSCVASLAEERTERFDRDPNWDARNNRIGASSSREVKQDFGFSRTAHAGGQQGELGGFITAAAEPAYYAKKLPAKSFDDVLTSSGSLACTGAGFHALIGFFNSDSVKEWRTPSSIVLRISRRGDVFYAWLEYATKRWRAGGDDPQSFPMVLDPQNGRQRPKGFPAKGAVHRWTLEYDPKGNQGRGVVTATIAGVKSVCHLAEGHKADGATFNRFGLLNVMKSADDGGEVWLDDLKINGEAESFDRDPGWDAMQNRRTHKTNSIRPHFNFGYSATQHARGERAGELGGEIYRGDCRYPDRMACYADRLHELTLDKPIRAAGKVSLQRGVTDSGVLIGFFHSEVSMASNPSQEAGLPKSFLGISTDAPSREGFLFRPAYRFDGDAQGSASENQPRFYPDGQSHDWTLEYSPSGGQGQGEIRVTLDGQAVVLPLGKNHKAAGSKFNRFGLITPWVDGNAQTIFFDDLRYTCKQD